MQIVAAVAPIAGIILIAGNATLALGLGFVALASYLVVTGIMERLERIEHTVEDLQHQADAERLGHELLHRPNGGARASDQQGTPRGSA